MTTRVTEALCVSVPSLAVMVRGNEPLGVVLRVVMVAVVEPEAAIVAGTKLTLAPAGSPPTLKLTVPEYPLTGAILTV